MADRLDFQLLSLGLRRVGWIRFWIQLTLAIVSAGVLIFYNIGGSLARNSQKAMGLGPGLSITTLAFFVLLYSLWQGWLIVKVGRALDSAARPTRGETGRLLKRGVIVDLLGSIFALIGYQALAGSLMVQASVQVPGFFGAPMGSSGSLASLPITSIEMLSVLSNTQVLSAHLIGLVLSLWLLQRIYRTS